MKNIVLALGIIAMPFMLSCSDEDNVANDGLVEESTQTEDVFTLRCPFSMPASQADTRALPEHTGEVSEDLKLCEIYDKDDVYLKVPVGNTLQTLPFVVKGDKEGRYIEIKLTVTRDATGAVKGVAFTNEANQSVEGIFDGKIDFYFCSHEADQVTSAVDALKFSYVKDGRKIENEVRQPIGDNIFRSDPYTITIQGDELLYEGYELEELEILKIPMNRCTCVLKPTLIITDMLTDPTKTKFTLSPDQVASLGDLNKWEAWTLLEEFPKVFDFTVKYEPNAHHDGMVINNKETDCGYVKLMSDYVHFKDGLSVTSHRGIEYSGVGVTETGYNPFVYWFISDTEPDNDAIEDIDDMVIPIKYQGIKKRLRVAGADLDDSIYDEDYLTYASNTFYNVYIIVEYSDFAKAFNLKGKAKTKSSVTADSDWLDIPYKVVVAKN